MKLEAEEEAEDEQEEEDPLLLNNVISRHQELNMLTL